MSDRIARRVRIHGEVQGVFFRDSTQREASSRGVSGWVRNCPDGTVEAWFEGAPDDVEALVAWARSGPSRAAVERVDVDEAEPERLGSFDVR